MGRIKEVYMEMLHANDGNIPAEATIAPATNNSGDFLLVQKPTLFNTNITLFICISPLH